MPRNHRRESPVPIYDEYDARSYSHLVPQNDKRVPRGQPHYDVGPTSNPPASTRPQKKQKKKKSRKKKERSEKRQSQNIKSLVAYDDISSDSDLSASESVPVPSRVETDRVPKRPMSPGTEIRSAIINQRGRSNSPGSPVAQTSHHRTSSKSKSKRPRQDRQARSPPDQRDQSFDSRDTDRHRGRNASSSRQPTPSNNSVRNHPPPPPSVPEPPLPRSFTDLPKAYSSRASSPPRPSAPKRYRSRSPTPNYRDGRRDNARSRSPLGGSRSSSSRYSRFLSDSLLSQFYTRLLWSVMHRSKWKIASSDFVLDWLIVAVKSDSVLSLPLWWAFNIV